MLIGSLYYHPGITRHLIRVRGAVTPCPTIIGCGSISWTAPWNPPGLPFLAQELTEPGAFSHITTPVKGKARVELLKAVFAPSRSALGLHLRGVLWQVLEPLEPLDNGLFVGPILGQSIVTSGGTCSYLRYLNPCKFHLLALAHTWLHLTVGLSSRQHGFKSRRGRHVTY